MTVRAVLLGLLGAALIGGVTYINDAVLHQTMLIGNNMPIAVYGSFILLILIINPLLSFAWKRLALTGPELALILALTLAACCIPGSNLMRTFTCALVMPFQHERTTPAWQKYEILKMVPPRMLVDVNAQNENEVLNGFIQGLGKGGEQIKLYSPNRDELQVPWYAWARTLAFWLPLILIFWIGLLGLSLVVHRQWAHHEQLPYPIATLANTLLPDGKRILADVFRAPLFWMGMVPVMLIHLNNYACKWFPDSVLNPTPVALNFSSMKDALFFPTMTLGGGGQFLTPTIYFAVIAIAYFIPADVSLTLGIATPLWALVVGVLMGYGINLGGEPGPSNFIAFGSYVGLVLILVYIGRRYYIDVFRRALWLPTTGTVFTDSVWGARVFLLAMGGFIAYISILGGLDWPIAILYTLVAVIILLAMGRAIAETGIFFLTPFNVVPHIIILGLFGSKALGPEALLIMLMLNLALLVDPRETLTPFIANGLRMVDLQRVSLGKSTALFAVALVVGLGVAVPVTLYYQYNNGANMSDTWSTGYFPKRPYDTTIRVIQQLTARDQLAQASTVSGLGHFANIDMQPRLLVSFLVGLGLMLLCSIARLRITKWPIHPVLFLLWTTWPLKFFTLSLLIGWAVKVAVTKFGGSPSYQKLKPLMVGLLAGELLGGVIAILIGAIYYLVTGTTPIVFNIMPG